MITTVVIVITVAIVVVIVVLPYRIFSCVFLRASLMVFCARAGQGGMQVSACLE